MKCTLYLITCGLRSPCQLCRGLKVMFPPQHHSFFLPSLWFPIYSLSQGFGTETDLHLQHRNMQVSCGLLHFKNIPRYHRLWSSGPDLAPQNENYLRTSPSISFSRPVGISVKALQLHLPIISFLQLQTASEDQNHRHKCFPTASPFLKNPHSLKAQKRTSKGTERWTSLGLRNCFILAQNELFKVLCSNIGTCIVPPLNHL